MQPVHPFQKLCQLSPRLLVAAAGSHLYGIDLTSGKINWEYTPSQPSSTVADGETSRQPHENHTTNSSFTHSTVGEGPTSKRRKLDPDSTTTTTTTGEANTADQPVPSRVSSQDSISITTERRKGERRRPKPPPPSTLPPATISHILSGQQGRALVVITAEDKAISVFDVHASGLERRSRRVMPKRLCAAVVVTRGGREWLVVGDKFGDVWEVPVQEDLDWAPLWLRLRDDEKGLGDGQRNGSGAEGGGGGGGGGGGYQPSATDLTVHTKRNLMALEQQKRLKVKQLEKALAAGAQAKDEEMGKGPGVEFEGRLLLGHVSLLTDVVVASLTGVDAETGSRIRRHYVLTSDRDEHVRVSRYPQSHVIEGFCLGMEEFVSRVSALGWKEEWVVVGTGEPGLRVFDWRVGKCLGIERFEAESLRQVIDGVVSVGEGKEGKLAVSGLWPVRIGHDGLVLVALEGLPLLFSYSLSDQGEPIHHQTIHLDGNVLDVAMISEEPALVVSIDTVHAPGSTQKYRETVSAEDSSLPAFKLQQDGNTKQWIPEPERSQTLWKGIEQIINKPHLTQVVSGGRQGGRKGVYSPLGEVLYGLENLRKKRGVAAQEAEEEDGLGEVEGEMEGLPGT